MAFDIQFKLIYQGIRDVFRVRSLSYYDDNLHWNDSPKAVTLTAETVTVVKNSGDPDAELYCFGNISHNISGNNDVYKVNIVKPGRRAMKAMEVDGVVAVCYDEPFKVITQYPSVMTDYDSNKDVSGYSITINNTSDNSLHTVYGGYSKDGNVSGNTATITNGKITDSVYGGYSSVGNVSNNTVNLNGGSVMSAYGGYTQGGAAETNHVVVDGGVAGFSSTGPVAGSYVYGGYSKNESGESKDVTGNTVTVKKGTVLASIFGGRTEASGSSGNSGDAVGNIVTVEDGTLAGDMYGGYSSSYRNTSGKVEGNKINITGGALDKVRNIQVNGIGLSETAGVRYIYGGYTDGDDASGIAKANEVNISGGTLLSDVKVLGGKSTENNAEGNIVKLESTFTGTVGTITGGEANKNTATQNKVTIAGGTVNNDVYGGKINNGTADNNFVTISGGTVNSKFDASVTALHGNAVFGGNSTSSGKVLKNTVTIEDGTVNAYAGVIGGYSNSGTAGGDAETDGNQIIIKGGKVQTLVRGGVSNKGSVKYNTVTITGGEVTQDVYGGSLFMGSGEAKGNTVTINGSDVEVRGVYGGNTSGSGSATKNKVEIINVKKANYVRGGYSNDGDAGGDTAEDGNIVTFNSGQVGGIIGGYANHTGKASHNVVTMSGGNTEEVKGGESWNGTATDNEVTISGGKVAPSVDEEGWNDVVFGGVVRSGTGNVTGNKVTISGGEVTGKVYGGATGSSGSASNNTVTISGGTLGENVYGGYGNSGAATGNTVSITDGTGTISKVVYGGYSEKGAATGNTVSIEGGTVSGAVTGGLSKSGDPTKNSVIISGGTFNGTVIFGGHLMNETSYNGSADDNTITISGGTFSGSNIIVQAAYTVHADSTTNNNTVNLTGTVTGLENVSFSGGGSNTSNTGNELHVGGIKGGANGVWQGKTGDTVNNKVKYVSRFDKVVLHSVKWDKDVAALEATTVENVGTLDITNLKFYTDAEGTSEKTSFTEGESMALLKSGSNLSAITLTYEGGANKTITPAGIIVKDGSGEQTEATGVNGVKLTQRAEVRKYRCLT